MRKGKVCSEFSVATWGSPSLPWKVDSKSRIPQIGWAPQCHLWLNTSSGYSGHCLLCFLTCSFCPYCIWCTSFYELVLVTYIIPVHPAPKQKESSRYKGVTFKCWMPEFIWKCQSLIFCCAHSSTCTICALCWKICLAAVCTHQLLPGTASGLTLNQPNEVGVLSSIRFSVFSQLSKKHANVVFAFI